MSDSSEAQCRPHANGMSACSICGTANAHYAGFCRCCGVSITRAGTSIGPVDGAGACGECGRTHAMPARFCDQCGGRLPGFVRPPALTDAASPNISATAPLAAAGYGSGEPFASRNAVPEHAARQRSLRARYVVLPALAMAVFGGIYFSGYPVAKKSGHTDTRLTDSSSGVTAAAYPDAIARPTPHDTLSVATAMPPLAARPTDDVAALISEPPGFARATVMPLATGFASLAQEPPHPLHAMRGIAHRAGPVAPKRILRAEADTNEAGEAPVSVIRELPPMPMVDFISILPVDATKK